MPTGVTIPELDVNWQSGWETPGKGQARGEGF